MTGDKPKVEVAKYLLRFSWIPVAFTVVGLLAPLPLFSLHGGPAWLVLFGSVPIIIIFYIVRTFKAPDGRKRYNFVLNLLSAVIYISLVALSSILVSGVVTEKF
jgi:hypothetical protein